MILVKIVVSVIVYFAVVCAIMFGSAGRIDLPLFWAYLIVNAALTLYAGVEVYRRNPDLVKEQTRPGGESADKLGVPAVYAMSLVHWMIAGLDVGRYHWSSSVPFALQVVGLIGFGVGFALVSWSTITNRFYLSAVRIQTDRGQEVITTGPYRFVRHPGYIGWILYYVSSGIALGSWLSMLPMLLLVVITLRRTLIEDKMLRGSLTGYADYADIVRYRLIPGVW